MANYRFQVALRRVTGMPEDDVMNVWHTKDALGTATAGSAQDAVFAFGAYYQAIQGYFSEYLISEATGAHSIKAYALSVGAAGAADDNAELLLEDFLSTPACSSAAPFPAEVAVCLSMAADPDDVPEYGAGSTRPRARRRGRVYIGPMVTTPTLTAIENGAVRPSSAFRTGFLAAASDLVDQLNAVGHELCVYSRTDGVMRSVTELSCDNAFDTVRSRGVDPTVRQTVLVTQP